MKLSRLFEKAKLDYPSELGDIEITEIITDSRKVCQGCLFLCIKGEHYDGHDYIGEAINAGAKVIVAENVRDVGEGGAAAIICVENTRRAASLLYNSWYGVNDGDMKIIGVTGTNGKTSVTNILKKIFEADGKRCGLIGTLGCFFGEERIASDSDSMANMTTPDPRELFSALSEMKERGAEYVFIEVSSHALALSKVDSISFEAAAFTNLTRDHLDFHLTVENYLESKARLFSLCKRAIINIDDKNAEYIKNSAGCKEIYTVSAEKEADYYAKEIVFYSDGVKYRFVCNGGEVPISTRLSGSFALFNTLMAAATADACGISHKAICDGLSDLSVIDGRMERVELEASDLTFIIDYAHTPDALEKLLLIVRELRRDDERIVLLFGCGGDRDRGKRKEMAQIASRLSDFIIVTSDNSRSEPQERIIRDILWGIDKEKEFVTVKDRRRAIEYAVFNSRPRDIIILAGKGHERYEIDATGKHPFDERKIIKEAYRELKKRTKVDYPEGGQKDEGKYRL